MRSLSNQCFYWTFAAEKGPENAATADLADTVERLTSVTKALEICCSHSKRHQKRIFYAQLQPSSNRLLPLWLLP